MADLQTRKSEARGRFTPCPSRSAFWLALVALGVMAGRPIPAGAQDDAAPAAPSAARADGEGPGGEVVPAGCSTCTGGLLGAPGPGPSLAPAPGFGCPTGACYPGRRPCDCCYDADTKLGRLLGGVYECICCPDPCYEPRWVPLANAALFVDPARPATQLRLRGDFGWDMRFPDKAEWFWAQVGGRGPRPPAGVPAGPGGTPGERRLAYREGYLYTEGATDRVGVFVELSYRNHSPSLYEGSAGFGDMNVGTKTLLLDCELLQLTFQFRTFIPTGNASEGLGTGHVSLEPSLLWALKLTPEAYLQGQLAYWFPIGGTSGFEGPVFHYHLSLNKLLCHCGEDLQLIGTAELNGFEIAGGAFTDVTGFVGSAKDVGHILSAGPGLRLSVCNVIDFGVGAAFAVTRDRMAGQLLRAEFRWRF